MTPTSLRRAVRLAAPALLAAALVGTASDFARGAPEDGSAAPVARAEPERSRVAVNDAPALERRERRTRAAETAGPDAVVLVLASGGARGFTGLVRSDDFHYVCPFAAADGAVVIFHDGENIRHRVYLQPRRQFAERWNGPSIGPGDETAAAQHFDAALPIDRLIPDLAELVAERSELIVSASAPADGSERLDAVLSGVKKLLPPGRTLLRRDRGSRRGEQAVESDHAIRVVSATPLLTQLRASKSEAEIERIKRAVEATVDGLRSAARCIRPGLAEYQIQAVIEFHCRTDGCEKQAFDSIVGSGPNSCILHYMANRRTMRAGDLVVVDVGGEFDGYAADVTRTFPVSGTFTERQAEIYDAVLAAQKAGIAAVRPGVTLGEIHAVAKGVLAERGLDRWFLHGTSHSVGLNVHDAWARDRKLEVGSVLTVEPGVYIAEEALGIRIEDTVLVTADGPIVLSAGVPKERADVEALMAHDAPFALAPPR